MNEANRDTGRLVQPWQNDTASKPVDLWHIADWLLAAISDGDWTKAQEQIGRLDEYAVHARRYVRERQSDDETQDTQAAASRQAGTGDRSASRAGVDAAAESTQDAV